MRVTALITLVIGKPSESRSIMPGAEAELSEAEAKRLIALGFAEARTAAVVKPVDLQDAIMDAIADLEPDSFGKDGKPAVKAIEAVLGQDITATDRDRAWAAYQSLLTDGQ